MNTSRHRLIWLVFAVACFWLLVVPPAYAYVDAGTGSYIFQVLIGAFLGIAVAVKVFWGRIWAFVSRKPKPVASRSEPAARTSKTAAGRDKED